PPEQRWPPDDVGHLPHRRGRAEAVAVAVTGEPPHLAEVPGVAEELLGDDRRPQQQAEAERPQAPPAQFAPLGGHGPPSAAPAAHGEHRQAADHEDCRGRHDREVLLGGDRKSTRLNSSHVKISYAVFCLKKKTEKYK